MATMTVARAVVVARRAAPVARRSVVSASLDIKKFAVAGAAALFLSAGAVNAATVKMGSDSGALEFVPSSLSIKVGDSVDFVNNAGFPHNVVFDEDGVPAGVDADSLSHEDLLNAPGESVSTKFTKAGTYTYHCEPHEGAGMSGKIVVS